MANEKAGGETSSQRERDTARVALLVGAAWLERVEHRLDVRKGSKGGLRDLL
jgi:hypothetical protein